MSYTNNALQVHPKKLSANLLMLSQSHLGTALIFSEKQMQIVD